MIFYGALAETCNDWYQKGKTTMAHDSSDNSDSQEILLAQMAMGLQGTLHAWTSLANEIDDLSIGEIQKKFGFLADKSTELISIVKFKMVIKDDDVIEVNFPYDKSKKEDRIRFIIASLRYGMEMWIELAASFENSSIIEWKKKVVEMSSITQRRFLDHLPG